MTKQEELVACARSFLGVPFRHMGRNEHGVDCIGLVISAVDKAGLGAYETPGYDRQPARYALSEGIASYLTRISVRDIQRGDVLVFRFGRYPQHVGIFSDPSVIHCYERVGCVIEHRLDAVWRKRLYSAFRFKEFM